MTPTSLRLLAPLPGIALVLAIGCSGGSMSGTSTPEEAEVTGTVKYRKKAVSGGEIVFDGSNTNRPAGERRAAIGKDGRYTIKALVGENNVTVESKATLGDITAQTGVFYEVKPGANSFDVSLPPSNP